MTKPTDKSKHERPKWMRDAAASLREKMKRDAARKKAKQNEGIVDPEEAKKINKLREGPLYK